MGTKRKGRTRPARVRESLPAAISALEAGGSPRRAKLFWNGRSQAVRLPKEFRFEGDEVAIRREGGRVILEPITKRGWPRSYWERLAELTRDFDFPDVEPLGGRLLDVSFDDGA
jgi:antitoxin VapB